MDFYIVWTSFLMPADFPEAANADIKEFQKKAADITGLWKPWETVLRNVKYH
jgi:hypothetical protein